jgi:hypothetical protein
LGPGEIFYLDESLVDNSEGGEMKVVKFPEIDFDAGYG